MRVVTTTPSIAWPRTLSFPWNGQCWSSHDCGGAGTSMPMSRGLAGGLRGAGGGGPGGGGPPPRPPPPPPSLLRAVFGPEQDLRPVELDAALDLEPEAAALLRDLLLPPRGLDAEEGAGLFHDVAPDPPEARGRPR